MKTVDATHRLYSEEIERFLKTLNSSDLVDTLSAMVWISFDKSYTRAIDVGKGGKVTFLPKGKDSDGTYSESTRQETTFGKMLRKILKENEILEDYTDSQIEEITNFFKAEYDLDSSFNILEGEDLRKSYLESSYDGNENLGTLGSSCMRYAKCQYFLDIYVDNCKMVVLNSVRNPDKIIGRALLWTLDDGTIFMDRIYGTDSVQSKFLRYAKSKGWITKKRQSADNRTEFIDANGKVISKRISIQLDKDYTFFPYLDTFRYYDAKQKTIHNGVSAMSKDREMSGYQQGNNPAAFKREFKNCADTSNTYHISEMVEFDGRHVHKSRVVTCYLSKKPARKSNCRTDIFGYHNEYVDVSKKRIMDTNDGKCLREEVIYCNITMTFHHKSNFIFDKGMLVHKKVKGKTLSYNRGKMLKEMMS